MILRRARVLSHLRKISTEYRKPHGIFVNNQIDLKSCKIFGFDYDYTLAEYKEATQKFIFDSAKVRLCEKYGFPEAVKSLEFDPNFVIRGLFYDPKRSLMMKLDSYSVIDDKAVFRGLERVSKEELDEIYSTRRMGVHRTDQKFSRHGHSFYQVLDEFSIPEAYLFSSVRQLFTDQDWVFDPILIFNAIKQAIGDVHIKQDLYREIVNNIDQYLEKESMYSVVNHLSNQKTLFIISNSPFWFIDAGMRHLVSNDWREAFDVVITEAKKPSFFLERKPFLELKAGKNPHGAGVRFQKRENWLRPNKLEKGKIYYSGSLHEFGKLTGWNQKEVLYFGDQVNADLAEPSLRFGWRTAAVIPELDDEIDTYNAPGFKNLVQRLNHIEFEYDLLASKENHRSTDHQYAHSLMTERAEIKKALKAAFKSPFGSIFRADLSKTHFARQLERYAELYTCSIRNLDEICLNRTFFPPRTTLGYDHQLHLTIEEDSNI